MIWIGIALLTGLAALSILLPLSRRGHVVRSGEASRAFYDAQIAELERDRDRKLISGEEYESARTEAARRLIVSVESDTAPDASPLIPRRVASLVALVAMPAVALGIYALIGAPSLDDRPLQARLNAPPGQIELVAAVAKIEKHLRRNPEDGRGWAVIAPVYMRMNRYDDAVRAWTNVIRLAGSTPDRHAALGEALVFAAKGRVTDEALQAFDKALGLEPGNRQATFFKGLAAEQKGDIAEAKKIWTGLVANAPKDAPWAQSIRERIAALDKAAATPQGGPGSDTGKAIAAMPAGEQASAIRAMVEGLAAKLQEDGKNFDGWMMLIRAYSVLKEEAKARDALAKARTIFANDGQSLEKLDAHAKSLGLGD
ncbi:MAG: c-type cytochrome biogenesis protein CcmI [Beijerinckiaceae bacterium]